jgi:hypothetical protein
MLAKRFARAARQYGLSSEKFSLETSKFLRPLAQEEVRQLSLF